MAEEKILRGTTWVCGDYTDVYKILPEEYWNVTSDTMNAEELGKHAMAGEDPGFAAAALAGKYSMVVGGRNFGGGGKSIEQPIYALKGAGVKGIIAESVSRYFFRNAINNGLLIMICEGITSDVKTGDELEVNVSKGEIRNVTTGTRLQSTPIPDVTLEILDMGGYIPYTKAKMALK